MVTFLSVRATGADAPPGWARGFPTSPPNPGPSEDGPAEGTVREYPRYVELRRAASPGTLALDRDSTLPGRC